MFSFFKRREKIQKTDQAVQSSEPSPRAESSQPAVPAPNESVSAMPISQQETTSSLTGDPSVTIYSLSTCSHCKTTKKFLSDCTIKYEFIDVDLLKGDERKAILEDVKKFNPKCSFPTIVIGEKVIIGYIEEDIKEALGL